MLELFKRHFAAYESGDWDTYKADLSPDIDYEEVATGKTAKDIPAYLDMAKKWKAAFPDLKGTIQRFSALDDIALLEVLWEGTQRGPLETPFGTIQPTNKLGSVRAVLIGKMKDGKIAEVRHYFDLMTVLRQLQAAPTVSPKAATAQPVVH